MDQQKQAGDAAVKAGRYVEALELYKTAAELDTDPKSFQSKKLRLAIKKTEAKIQEAQQKLDAEQEPLRKAALKLKKTADKAYKKGDLKAAQTACKEALALIDGAESDLISNEPWSEIQSLAEKVSIEIQEADAVAMDTKLAAKILEHRQRGDRALEAHDFDGAASEYRAGLQLQPDNIEQWPQSAAALQEDGGFEAALRDAVAAGQAGAGDCDAATRPDGRRRRGSKCLYTFSS